MNDSTTPYRSTDPTEPLLAQIRDAQAHNVELERRLAAKSWFSDSSASKAAGAAIGTAIFGLLTFVGVGMSAAGAWCQRAELMGFGGGLGGIGLIITALFACALAGQC